MELTRRHALAGAAGIAAAPLLANSPASAAAVPLAAGIFEMPYWRFQIANWVSALVWSAALLLFGDVIGQIAEWLWRTI